HQIMTRAIVAASPDDAVSDAACQMFRHGISCLPVLDEDEGCVGIVTLNDVLRWLLDHHYEGGASACKAA
ncbi:MAG: CBS domain-containing protein, partial [Phycisphaerales bacterium]|nr:CBS domain-containing protein [Phycisphaerales bacterium]